MPDHDGHRSGSRDDDERREADFFDAFIQREGNFDPFTEDGWKVIRQRFRELVPRTAFTILDVGCGAGRSFAVYEPFAARYVGVDLSFAALAVAARQIVAPAPCRWVRANALQLSFASASFDVVAFSSVLHHIPDFGAALIEAARVVRPGGAVFAFDPNLLNPAMAALRHPRSPLYQSAGVSPLERPLLPSVLRRAFEQAGLTEVVQRAQSGIAFRPTAVGAVNAFLPLYLKLDRALEAIGAGRWIGSFVMTAGVKPL